MRSLFRFISAVFGLIWRCVEFLRRVLVTLFFLLFLFLLISLFAGRQQPVLDDGVLVVNLSGRLTEQLEGTPFQLALQQAADEPPAETRLQDVVKAIDLGAEDDRVEALLLDTALLESTELTKLRQISAAVARFRDSGKPVYAHALYYNQGQYYLAAQADKVALDPYGAVLIEGFGTFPRYFAEALDKLKITMNVFRVGEYKSAVEPFLRSDMSAEAKRANQLWLDQLWNSWRVDVESRRQLSLGAMQRYADNYPELLKVAGGNSAAAAQKAGLVDWLETRHAFEQRLVKQYGKDDDNRFRQINYRALLADHERNLVVEAVKSEVADAEDSSDEPATSIQSELANDPLAIPSDEADDSAADAIEASSAENNLFAEAGRESDALDAAEAEAEAEAEQQQATKTATKPSGTRVGLIYAVGAIMGGEQPGGTVGGDSMSALIDQARRDKDIAALVLRVDSPGGSVFASEQIRQAVERLRAAGKPVVVSMGTYAASGGYWISMNADEIWASPTTLTGSIGIFGLLPEFSKLVNSWGVYVDGIGTTKYAGADRLDRPMSEGVRQVVQQSIDFGYNEFIRKVASARELPVDQVDAIARGRVWTGLDALKIGLVDQLGTQTEAELAARRLAGLSADAPVELVEPEGAEWTRLMTRFAGRTGQSQWLAGAVNSMVAFANSGGGGASFKVLEHRLFQKLAADLDGALPAWLGSDQRGVYAYCFCEI